MDHVSRKTSIESSKRKKKNPFLEMAVNEKKSSIPRNIIYDCSNRLLWAIKPVWRLAGMSIWLVPLAAEFWLLVLGSSLTTSNFVSELQKKCS